MFWKRKKIKVNLINSAWKRIKNDFPVDSVPRASELLIIDDTREYYRVIQVVHQLNNNYGIFIVIEKLTDMEGRLTNKITRNRPKNEN